MPFIGAFTIGARPAESTALIATLFAPATGDVAVVSDSTLERYASAVASNDPFRFSHQPPLQPYDPGHESIAPPVVRQVRPTLVVQGTIGSRGHWEAIVAGIPGRDGGTVVRTGDTLAGLRIAHIDRDTVTVRTADSTWRLIVKTGWP